MLGLLGLLLLGSILYYAYSTYRALSIRIAGAKKSGLKYVIVPVFQHSRPWLILRGLIMPYVNMLPDDWTSSWKKFVAGEWVWHLNYGPFEELGTDTFLTIAPGGSVLYTCDPDVVSQITTRRNDFPKPTEIYEAVNIYGPNVVGTEGSVWRHHRKITSPPFTEKNNELVWAESMEQTQAMLASWLSPVNKGVVQDIGSETMRLTLHVISRAGFGKKMVWPKSATTSGGESESDPSSDVVPPGHISSYKDALTSMLDHLLWIILMPTSLLKNSPFVIHKKAWAAYVDWRLYMEEIFNAKKAEMQRGPSRESLDLIGALVKGAGVISDDDDHGKSRSSTGQLLSSEEIIGNAFIFLLAGHETTATTTQMAIIYLACNPTRQQRLQQELQAIFGDRSLDEWEYEKDLPKLFNGYTGAIMNETLRLVPPVVNIPKIARQPQPLTVAGKRVLVPEDTSITLNVPATHRNPHHWPAGPPSPHPSKNSNDLSEFKPERWFLNRPSPNPATTTTTTTTTADIHEETDEFGGPGGRDTAATMFRPTRGAYLAFSEGARACLGRRFAQVEVLVVLAVIFSRYSVELCVDRWASEKEVAKMTKGGPERKAVWEKARRRADMLLSDGMESRMTLQMRAGTVKVKVAEKGQEQWIGLGY